MKVFARFFILLFLLYRASPDLFSAQELAVDAIAADSSGKSTISFGVPVRMQGVGFYSVNGFSFYIGYDATKLQFLGVQPIAVSNVSAGSVGNLISVQWSNPSVPVNMTNNTHVFNLLFSRIGGGTVNLDFLPGSRVSGVQGLIAVNYTNTQLLPFWELSTEPVPLQGGTTLGDGSYLVGQSVNVSAQPAEGYLFDQWTLNGTMISAFPSFAYSMPAANVNLKAHFVPKTYQVITHALPAQGGTTTGSGFYNFGQTVTVSATAATGFEFVHWERNGEVVSMLPVYSFAMPAGDLDIWARFEPLPYQLSLTATPPNGGNVSGAGSYLYTQPVTALATPAIGFHFVHWTEGSTVVSTDAAYNFPMPAANRSLSARFLINSYNISVLSNHTDYGSVSGGGVFEHGSTVTIVAQPNEGYLFSAWLENGISVSFNAVYSFVAESDRTLTAVFQEENGCPTPINLNVNNLSETTATLHWVSPVQNNQWFVLWGPSINDTIAGEGWLELTTVNNWTLTGLEPQTLYVFYVKTLCGAEGESQWSQPAYFQTWYVGNREMNDQPQPVLFPNPGNGLFRIKENALLSIPFHAVVSDLKGNQLQSVRFADGHNLRLDMRHLPAGIYLVRLFTPAGNYMMKYVKIW